MALRTGHSPLGSLSVLAFLVVLCAQVATGLVSEVVPDDQLEAAAQPYIDEMLAASPMGLRLTKEGLNLATDAPCLEAAIAMENRNQTLCARSEDFAEGLRAFIEKRPPVYKDA